MAQRPVDWSATYELESELSAAVHEYLKRRSDHCITRVEAGRTAHRKSYGKTKKGTADWAGPVRGGMHVEIELKKRKGVSSPEQIARGQKVRSLGGVYEVCRSVGDVHRAIESAMPDEERRGA